MSARQRGKAETTEELDGSASQCSEDMSSLVCESSPKLEEKMVKKTLNTEDCEVETKSKQNLNSSIQDSNKECQMEMQEDVENISGVTAKSVFSEKVESLNIKENSDKTDQNKEDMKTSEAPKKKRIQFTTISLKK